MNRTDISIYQKAKKGNYYCGDSYYYNETEDDLICAIADGLGSGEQARESSQIVMDIIKENSYVSVEQLVKRCNKKLFGKRGVVLGFLKMDFTSKMYTFTSIGNIGIVTINKDNKKQRNIPNSGFLAGYPRTLKVKQGKLENGMVFIMFSDGVKDSDLSAKYFMSKDVEKITEMYSAITEEKRDDDTTLIVMKYTEKFQNNL